jgi:type I restriction enzyme S subunit
MEKAKFNNHFISDIYFYQEGPGVRKWQFRESGVKLLNVGNINNGKIDLSSTKINISEEEANNKYSHFLIDEGDLLIACSGIVVENFHNKIAFVNKENLPLCLNTSTMRFKQLPEKKGELKYLKYFLQTDIFKEQLSKLITGSAQLNFGPSHIRKIEIPLPSLQTQQKIATILDKADELRQYNKQLIEKYDALTQSLFLDMFGDPFKNNKKWEMNSFGHYITVLTDYHANGSYESLKEVVELKDERDFALMVRTTDLEKNNFDNDVKYITEEAYNFLTKSKVFGNEIIINKIGSAGNVYLMPALNRPVSLGMNAFLLRFNENQLNVLFTYFLLKTKYCESEIKKRVKGAVTKTIRKDAIREIPIIVPPIELQNQFAERLQLIETQKQQTLEALAKSELLFQGLLQQAFKGELN